MCLQTRWVPFVCCALTSSANCLRVPGCCGCEVGALTLLRSHSTEPRPAGWAAPLRNRVRSSRLGVAIGIAPRHHLHVPNWLCPPAHNPATLPGAGVLPVPHPPGPAPRVPHLHNHHPRGCAPCPADGWGLVHGACCSTAVCLHLQSTAGVDRPWEVLEGCAQTNGHRMPGCCMRSLPARLLRNSALDPLGRVADLLPV